MQLLHPFLRLLCYTLLLVEHLFKLCYLAVQLPYLLLSVLAVIDFLGQVFSVEVVEAHICGLFLGGFQLCVAVGIKAFKDVGGDGSVHCVYS